MVNVWYFLFLFSFVVFLIFIAVVTSIPGLFGDPLLWRVPKDWYFLIPLPMKVRIFVPHLVQLNLCLIGIHRPIFTIRNSSCTKVMFYTCLWFCSQGDVYLWVQGEGGCIPPGQTPPRQTPLWANTLLGRHSLEQTPLLGRHTPTLGRHSIGRHWPPETATAADCLHPTEMHSCFDDKKLLFLPDMFSLMFHLPPDTFLLLLDMFHLPPYILLLLLDMFCCLPECFWVRNIQFK